MIYQSILFLLFLIYSNVLWATPARYADRQIQFAIATVQGDPVFTADEQNQAIASYQAQGILSPTIVSITPTAIEVNVSTCITNFDNYSDFLACQTKAGLRAKYFKIKQERDVATDLNDNPSDIRARVRWLLQYYQSLP